MTFTPMMSVHIYDHNSMIELMDVIELAGQWYSTGRFLVKSGFLKTGHWIHSPGLYVSITDIKFPLRTQTVL